MFENSGELVILALAVVVAFLIATVLAERRLSLTLQAERQENDREDQTLFDLLPPQLSAVDSQTVRLIDHDLRATA